jgi:hypothetical protein
MRFAQRYADSHDLGFSGSQDEEPSGAETE